MAPTKEVVETDKVTLPLNPSPFCLAVKCNGMVYCSGSVGIDPKTNKLVDGDIKERTRATLNNLKNVLEAAGSSLNNIVKMNIYLTDMKNFAPMNQAYLEYFPDYKPARTCVAVYQLPLNADVEMECTAHQ
ncbi:Endoribonuclease L-PSP [Rhizodiscina lignyota]|uniref:Endoribonuclease L-PSP n=1 Tax=Rhizodiscina lignyota TaxID=1504668 RepID=A0A9P4I551_9PEZI|nr:Endoribonuclease L-PSP [Rhizodiscina lignyota]